MEQIEHEMKIIADSGMEEILILTGESRAKSSVEYIGEACKLARKYFRMVGVEVYPVNVDEYRYLHECGVDYVTVFQETYDKVRFEKLHLLGHKRVFPYRFDSQERALMAGMRGVAFSALLGLSDFRRDALASALHVYYLQKKYPHAEMSLSCPRLRPIINNDKIDPLDVHEKELCQVLCAYRIFLPFVGITVSSRESKEFRNGIVKIAATKVSAGVSTGIGDHESKYSGHDDGEGGDEQFEINDSRSFNDMYGDISGEGLQPVLERLPLRVGLTYAQKSRYDALRLSPTALAFPKNASCPWWRRLARAARLLSSCAKRTSLHGSTCGLQRRRTKLPPVMESR
jgi:Thiamine biosynthesis enzyme ThiH and related uncharacterized enzymes